MEADEDEKTEQSADIVAILVAGNNMVTEPEVAVGMAAESSGHFDLKSDTDDDDVAQQGEAVVVVTAVEACPCILAVALGHMKEAVEVGTSQEELFLA